MSSYKMDIAMIIVIVIAIMILPEHEPQPTTKDIAEDILQEKGYVDYIIKSQNNRVVEVITEEGIIFIDVDTGKFIPIKGG